MSKEVKRYYVQPSGPEYLVEMTDAYRAETGFAGLIKGEDFDALLVELGLLREALNFSCKSLCNVTSSDGSGHADIALGVLRLAGVGADEREALVDGWKANVQWRIDRAALQGAQP